MDQGQNDTIEKLAALVKGSNEVAFNSLFNQLWEPMFGYAKSILMDEALSQDIVQNVWVDYWNRRKQIETTNIKAYLFKATR
ncbi:MAG: RNA polymerase sigma-70 factor, partial [Bacteroidota bacterium]